MTYAGEFEYRPVAAEHRLATQQGQNDGQQQSHTGVFGGDNLLVNRDVHAEVQQASHNLLGPMFDRMREQQQQRQQRVEKRREQQGAGNRMNADSQPVKIENKGGIQSLELPSGFGRPAEQNGANLQTMTSRGPGDTTIGYYRRTNFSIMDPNDRPVIERMMQAGPHTLTDEEQAAMSWLGVPGLWASGNSEAHRETQQIGGKTVIVCDYKFKDTNKEVRVMYFNPDEKNKTVEALWIDGRATEVAKYSNLFNNVHWANPAPAPQK